ncbi:hypothetical protein Mkiyose1088_25510 [Mycobacterium kiyosense]|nr:hypothetical protein Mkiyose1088_25510 [Mycobacterium kiyosense]
MPSAADFGQTVKKGNAMVQRGGHAVVLGEVVELAADHGSIAGAQYDPIADRYEPANDALGPAREVASRIAAVVSRPGL